MWAYARECRGLERPEVLDPLELELPHAVASCLRCILGTELGSSKEQCVLSTAESSLQFPSKDHIVQVPNVHLSV